MLTAGLYRAGSLRAFCSAAMLLFAATCHAATANFVQAPNTIDITGGDGTTNHSITPPTLTANDLLIVAISEEAFDGGRRIQF